MKALSAPVLTALFLLTFCSPTLAQWIGGPMGSGGW
jgi:hypothetical protein